MKTCYWGIGISQQPRVLSGHFGRQNGGHGIHEVVLPTHPQMCCWIFNYCDVCQCVDSYRLQIGNSTLGLIPVPLQVWSQIGTYLISLQRTMYSYRYVITSLHYASYFIEAEPLMEKTGEVVAKFLNKLLWRYRSCKIHITDQGRELFHSIT